VRDDALLDSIILPSLDIFVNVSPNAPSPSPSVKKYDRLVYVLKKIQLICVNLTY